MTTPAKTPEQRLSALLTELKAVLAERRHDPELWLHDIDIVLRMPPAWLREWADLWEEIMAHHRDLPLEMFDPKRPSPPAMFTDPRYDEAYELLMAYEWGCE